jgi:predicted component of type VI protein secretion system
MKLNLEVLTPGKMQGKTIPITLSQFLIGRDPQCHLRPSSPLISKRHCALLVRGGKVYVRDFDSTNGTSVDGQRVKREQELHPDSHLQIGPLEFRVCIETSPPVTKPTPLPAPAASPEDEAAAAMLLSVQDDDAPPPGSPGVDSEGIPIGSTVMDILKPPADAPVSEEDKKPEDKGEAAKAASANTSTAAKAILEKYMRRQRT